MSLMTIANTGRFIWREMLASYAFVERNFNLVKRYWGWEIVWLAYSIASALSITYIGAGMEQISGASVNANYLVLYLLIGTLLWRYLSIVFDAISEMIAWERWEGTVEYTFMAPVSRLTHMVGQTIFSLVWGLIFTGVIFLVVVLFFHLDVEKANLLGATAVLIASSISFIGFGITAAVLPLLFPERGAQMTNVVQAVLLLISGVYYPTTVLPEWMQVIAHASPATYALEAMRAAILGNAAWSELIPDLALLMAMGLVTIPAGAWIFARAEHYAKRAGKLKRTG
jgi:ABC-2 type transport system permease protein